LTANEMPLDRLLKDWQSKTGLAALDAASDIAKT
jgi:hypothetical protein